MINPGSVAGQIPPGDDAIIRRIQDLERVVREMAAQDVLRTAGLIASPNKLTVQGELDVTGSMVVGGTLTLPAGIIGNDALANPTVFGSVGGSASNFAVTATHTIFASQNITVPAGFTQATIAAWVDTTIYSTGAADYLYIQGNIGGVAGGTAGVSVGGGSYNGREASAIRTLTGLVGGSTIAVGATIFTQSTTIAASASNIANVNAIALFLR